MKPWFSVGFLNTWGNSVEGGRNFDKRVGSMARIAASGSPALHAFSEVRPSQVKALSEAMAKYNYKLSAYNEDNMLAVYHRKGVTILGKSFSRFSQQDGGNVEGVLRVRFRVGASIAQIGVLHLDHDSPEYKKASNLQETYEALRRYGRGILLPDWRSRTIIIGDFNDDDVASKVLSKLGFKEIDFNARLDKAWVGIKRAVRGKEKTETNSDHPRILVKLAKK